MIHCKVDLDELHLAETHMLLQEMIEEGTLEEITRSDGKMGYRVIKTTGEEDETQNIIIEMLMDHDDL